MTKLPKEGSLMYRIMENKGMTKEITLFRRMNKYLVVPLFRIHFLPLLGMGSIFLLLRTVGRRTKKIRYTPLEYRKINGKFYLFSSRGKYSDWYQNMLACPDEVKIKHHFFWKKPVFRDLRGIDERINIFKIYAVKYPRAAKSLFGFDKKVDLISELDFTALAEFTRVIEFTFS